MDKKIIIGIVIIGVIGILIYFYKKGFLNTMLEKVGTSGIVGTVKSSKSYTDSFYGSP